MIGNQRAKLDPERCLRLIKTDRIEPIVMANPRRQTSEGPKTSQSPLAPPRTISSFMRMTKRSCVPAIARSAELIAGIEAGMVATTGITPILERTAPANAAQEFLGFGHNRVFARPIEQFARAHERALVKHDGHGGQPRNRHKSALPNARLAAVIVGGFHGIEKQAAAQASRAQPD